MASPIPTHPVFSTRATIASWFIVILLFVLFAPTALAASKPSPVSKHGALSVSKNQIVNQQGQPVSLAGPSLFWSWDGAQGEAFYTADVVKYVARQWQAGLIRAAMAAQGKGSYLDSPKSNEGKVDVVVKAAIEEGLYVIIDWHSHQAEQDVEKAKTFFRNMATRYGDQDNVIYEIYNEPLNTTDWDTVIKPYSQALIAAIREIDPDNLILVGTQTWSQDVDKVIANPITDATNIAYSLHFYAGTHKQALRDKAKQALLAGIPLFVSEWGTVNANGDGAIAHEEVEQWLAFIRDNQLSFATWSMTNKKEGSAIFKPATDPLKPLSDKDLTENGIYLKSIIKQWGY
ncbi:glycoside hydrolase family 5 protein [Thalassotalea litorea]|uniref:glycoside hydrolase family 5 protein n=1 Tax=Thalassotalea litorea TaxID=2020715 RepID=UPI003735952E